MASNKISPTTFTSSVLVADTFTQANGSSDSIPAFTKSGSTPVSAALEIQSTTGALLPPRMTTAQRDLLVTTPGMQIYNTTTGESEVFSGGVWNAYGTGATTFHFIDTTGTTNNLFGGTGTGNAGATGT